MYTCGYQDVVMVYLRSDLALSSSSREDIVRMCVDNLLADPEERIFFKDLESRFLLVSAGWLAALTHGLSLAEVVGKTDFDIFSGPHATNAFADEQRVIETGQPMVARVERETFHDRPDIWVSTTKWPLRDVDGNIVGTWGISRDITAQVEAEQALATSHEQLRASERQHRMLFEHNPQPMFAYERATLRIVAVSDSAVASYGYSREECLTLTIKDVMPREDHESLERFLETTIGGEHPGFVEAEPWRHRYKDGTTIDVEVSGDDLDLDGRSCRILLCQNVTERNKASAELALAREQLRASERQHRMLFEHNPQPVWVYDRNTLEIVAASDTAVASYGYSREEVRSMTSKDLRPPEDVVSYLTYLETTTGKERLGFAAAQPHRHQYKDGTIIDVEVTSDDLTLDGRECRMAICQNVTERNRAAADLAAARDHAVEASNTKSAFLANMSHEIRTPMNGVIGITELLLDTQLTDEQREYANQVVRSGELMMAIINDILDVSKIEAGHLELDVSDFDLHETITQACAVAGLQANAKGVRLDVHIADAVPQCVRGDRQRLRQVLSNLLSNALKFTTDGSIVVAVSATPQPHGGARSRVEIADTGIGIDPAELDRMFEPFTQADASTTRNYGGTGLGLAIARELVELMGGTIGAASEPGRGSSFWFELALSAPVAPNGRLPPPGDVGIAASPLWSTAPRVLVAEDSPVNQIVAVAALERCGCTVDVVGDGRQALKALSAQRYDAVLMDCQMPEMDGYEATTELRRREDGDHHTPVIAMTAHAMDGDREKCLEAGMDDYISKPMRREQLIETLRRWIPAHTGTAAAGDPRPKRS
jgi:PAS domain S-box-containing protein